MIWFSHTDRSWLKPRVCPICRKLLGGALAGWVALAPAPLVARGPGPQPITVVIHPAPAGPSPVAHATGSPRGVSETLPPPRTLPSAAPTVDVALPGPVPMYANGGSMRGATPVYLPGQGHSHAGVSPYHQAPHVVIGGGHPGVMAGVAAHPPEGMGEPHVPMPPPEQPPLYGQPNLSSHPSDPRCKHWLHVDNCSSIPKGTMPAPRGTFLNAVREIQAAKAEADDFVFYKHEWCKGAIELGPYGTYHLREVIRRLGDVPFPVVIQPEVDNQINLARRALLVKRLLAAGVHDAEQRVVLAFPEAEGLYGDEALRIYYALITSQNALGNQYGSVGGLGGSGGFGGFGGFGGGGFGGFGGFGGLGGVGAFGR